MFTEQDYYNLLNKDEIKYKVEPKTIKVLCPFHNDTRESMDIYIDSLVWTCYKKKKGDEPRCKASYGMKSFNTLEEMLKEEYGY